MTPQTSKDESSVTFKKKRREKKRRNFFSPTDTPCAGGKSPRFYPYIAPNLREYKQMKEVQRDAWPLSVSIKVIYSVYTGSLFGNLGVFLCIDVHFNLIKQHSRFPFYLIYLVYQYILYPKHTFFSERQFNGLKRLLYKFGSMVS